MVHYKTKQSSEDLASLMDRYLRSEAAEEETKAGNISDAIDYISRAGEIFDGLNDVQASEAITVLLEKMAGK
jgi:flagellin-specific chaperone FliS